MVDIFFKSDFCHSTDIQNICSITLPLTELSDFATDIGKSHHGHKCPCTDMLVIHGGKYTQWLRLHVLHTSLLIGLLVNIQVIENSGYGVYMGEERELLREGRGQRGSSAL